MSWQMDIAIGVISVLLFVIAGFLYDTARALNRVEAKLNVLEELAKLLKEQNSELASIAEHLARESHGYIPPTIKFCDLCRKEYPESNRWWTASRAWGVYLRLCAYPQQKEKPEDKWLHGEECVIAETLAYMAKVRRGLEPIEEHKQKRECKELDDFGTETTRILKVSSCNHCGKKYSEPSLWWTVSRHGMEIEIREGFHHRKLSRDCYFCSEDCAVEAVKVFLSTQLRVLPEEAWEKYELAAVRSLL